MRFTSYHSFRLTDMFVSFFLKSLPLVLQNSVGLSNNLSRLLAACNSVSYLIFSFAGLYLIERAGRRKMMMWGAAGQCFCYIFISGLLSQSNTPGSKLAAGSTAFFFLYYVFFGICWQVRFTCLLGNKMSLSGRSMGNLYFIGCSMVVPN